MKRQNVILVVLAVFLTAAVVQAQSATLPPQSQEDLQRLSTAIRNLTAQQTLQQLQLQRGRGSYFFWVNGPRGGAWWTDTTLVATLGLTDDQKAKIQRAYENHSQDLLSRSQLLDKEEAQLARLLEAEPIDRNAVLAQVDRAIQARGDLERANSAMTLEMRESMTHAQWMQLQALPVWIGRDITAPGLGGPGQRGGARSGQRQQ